MRSSFSILLFLSLVFVSGCQKDNLDGGKALLVGKWEWVKSVDIKLEWYFFVDIEAAEEGWDYEVICSEIKANQDKYVIEISSSGKVQFKKNGILLSRMKLKLIAFEENKELYKYPCDYGDYSFLRRDYFFSGYLSNPDENNISGWVSQDTLYIHNLIGMEKEVFDIPLEESFFVRK